MAACAACARAACTFHPCPASTADEFEAEAASTTYDVEAEAASTADQVLAKAASTADEVGAKPVSMTDEVGAEAATMADEVVTKAASTADKVVPEAASTADEAVFEAAPTTLSPSSFSAVLREEPSSRGTFLLFTVAVKVASSAVSYAFQFLTKRSRTSEVLAPLAAADVEPSPPRWASLLCSGLLDCDSSFVGFVFTQRLCA